ncbi:glycoside hydrolase family 5 protein [Mycena floridula]|nr:glycoside hydrolase family 5 protein [Mycena floridula]
MRFFLISILCTLLYASQCFCANSFAAANNYYVYSLPAGDRAKLLDGMKAAGMTVLRTWVSGHGAGQKASSNKAVSDVEGGGIGKYDETILNQIDQLMVEAHDRGIKLLIENSLKGSDVYNKKYGPYNFHTDSNAISDFDNRIEFILSTHKNKLLGNKPWGELSTHIFGLESMNEPMIYNQTFYKQHLSWICNTSKTIRSFVENKDILITTGGGASGASVQSAFFDSSCPVDVISIHDYTLGYKKYMGDAISRAKSAGKKLIVEEWGSLVKSDRTGNLKANIQAMNSFKVPWVYWQLITNKDPHQGEDYEIQVNGDDWDTIKSGALATSQLSDAPFDFSASLQL